MFNIFNSTKEKQVKTKPKEPTTAEIVKQIHDEFYTEVDVLTDWAAKQKKPKNVNEKLLSKKERLEKLGFANTKEVKLGTVEQERIDKIEKKNQEKKDLLAAIQYFSQKYPQYKFITEKSVQKICEKYGLVYGELSRYEGSVPDKNLEQMEKFSVDEKDVVYHKEIRTAYVKDVEVISYKKYKLEKEDRKLLLEQDPFFFHTSRIRETLSKAPLEIAAPQDEFNLDGYKVEGFKVVKKPIKIPDPVVLQPVCFKDQKYYLIVTAWGDEAEDELVVNEKMN